MAKMFCNMGSSINNSILNFISNNNTIPTAKINRLMGESSHLFGRLYQTTSHSTTPDPMNRASRWYTVVTLLYDLCYHIFHTEHNYLDVIDNWKFSVIKASTINRSLSFHREPWSSGYGSRLMIQRSWVRIPANCCEIILWFEVKKSGLGWLVFNNP